MLSITFFVILAASHQATTYGFGETMCGDYEQAPLPCAEGALTASGEELDPDEISAAIPLPRTYPLVKPLTLKVKAHDGKCFTLRVNDKAHERWIGKRGFDLTPAAQRMITGKEPTRYWKGRIELC